MHQEELLCIKRSAVTIKSRVSNDVPSLKKRTFRFCFVWKLQNMSHHQQLRKGLGRGDLSHVAHTVRYQPEDSPSSNRIMQEWEKHLPLKKAYFTASGIPWKQQLKWADCCTPRRFFVYVAGGCLPAGNLHSPLPLSVYHQLHLWIEPLTRPNLALRGTGTNPMEENKIWVCIRQSKAWSLSTIFS